MGGARRVRMKRTLRYSPRAGIQPAQARPTIALVSAAAPSRFAPLLAFAAMALASFGGLSVAAFAQFAPGDSGRLVALYPPWWSLERALAAAAQSAPVAGAYGHAVGVVARRPGVARALRRGGAWFVADGAAFPACFSVRTSP
jgi:hypothetical protein